MAGGSESYWRWAVPFTVSLSVSQGVNCILQHRNWEKYIYLLTHTTASLSYFTLRDMKHFMSDKIFPLRLTVSAAAGNNEAGPHYSLTDHSGQNSKYWFLFIRVGIIKRFEKKNIDGYDSVEWQIKSGKIFHTFFFTLNPSINKLKINLNY